MTMLNFICEPACDSPTSPSDNLFLCINLCIFWCGTGRPLILKSVSLPSSCLLLNRFPRTNFMSTSRMFLLSRFQCAILRLYWRSLLQSKLWSYHSGVNTHVALNPLLSMTSITSRSFLASFKYSWVICPRCFSQFSLWSWTGVCCAGSGHPSVPASSSINLSIMLRSAESPVTKNAKMVQRKFFDMEPLNDYSDMTWRSCAMSVL